MLGRIPSLFTMWSTLLLSLLLAACNSTEKVKEFSITAMSPIGGDPAGGTVVTFTGTEVQFTRSIRFGTAACTNITIVDDSSMTCVAPAMTSSFVTVTAVNVAGKVATVPGTYSYQAAPTITSITPSTGLSSGGTLVNIVGTGFVAGASVTVGDEACTGITVVSSTTITCTTAANTSGAADVVVSNTDGQSDTDAGAFTYLAAPTILYVTPSAGPLAGGSSVTVRGTGFAAGATVDFGGNACTSVVLINPTTITCTTPTHAAGAVSVTVTNTDTQSGTGVGAYTYQAAPTVTLANPSGGALAGTTLITVTGTGFVTGATVTVGGVGCSPVTVIGATSLTCTTSAHAAGLVDVIVTNADTQAGTGSNLYTYQAAPTTTSVSPTSGFAAGGTSVTVTGTGFISGATVTLGGVACSTPSVVNATTITCTSGAHAAGAVNAVVTNADGQSGTAGSAFTYVAAPTVTSVSPNGGPLAGGTAITLTGTGFVTGATVTVGGVACTTPVVVNSTTMTCTTDTHAAGAVDVVATNTDTQAGTGTNLFTYRPAPAVTSSAPNVGALAGGTAITITGTDFVTGATATVGGVTCTTPVVVSATSMTCTTGAHAAGNVAVAVTNPDTQSGNNATAFTYQPAPSVTSVSPASGSALGGTSITITGSDFITGATITVGGVACTTPTWVDASTMTCDTAAHAAGAVDVVVTNTDAQTGTGTNAYTYLGAPTVTSVSPTGGALAGGTPITITGTGFANGATVTVGGVTCTTPVVVNGTTITCDTDVHAAGVTSIVVTNSDTQAGTGSNLYTYRAAPDVTSVSPNGGPLAGGTTVTITGTGFVTGATVMFDGSTCTSPVVLSATSMTCITPSHALGASDVTVTNADTQTDTASGIFTYHPAPTLTNVSPSFGPLAGNTAVTLTGTNFLTGATVSFGGAACTSVSVNSSTSITCNTPMKVVGGAVAVTVTNPDTQAFTLSTAFIYLAAPSVGSISPTAGSIAGGTAVTITGSGFFASATVSIGGVACTGVTVVSTSSITCTTGAHAAGASTVTVTNADSQAGSLSNGYAYQAAPTISGVSPIGGPLAGGTGITISGTGFVSGATVSVGGSACTNVAVVNATSITCTTPAHAAGAVSVDVTNADTQTVSSGSAFTYRNAPVVTSVTPSGGPVAGGTAVTITGANFNMGATVDFGGSACGTLTVVNATTITCTTSAHAAGATLATVTNTDTQVGTLGTAFTYQAAPTITGISPTSGITTGGTVVTITGTGFVAGATATFDGNPCTSLTVNSTTSITCTTPAGAAGAVDVAVVNSDTQSGSSAGGYTYALVGILGWQVGMASPTPPNPDPYGSSNTNITHTFTLENSGNATTSAISVSFSGTNPGAWVLGTDNCSGNTLAAAATCTVQVTFLGAFLFTGSYSATLNATASSGGSSSNALTGSVP